MSALWIAAAALAVVFLGVLVYGVVVRRLGAPVPLLVSRRRFTGGRSGSLSGWGAWADVLWGVLVVAGLLALVGALA